MGWSAILIKLRGFDRVCRNRFVFLGRSAIEGKGFWGGLLQLLSFRLLAGGMPIKVRVVFGKYDMVIKLRVFGGDLLQW